jgi:quinol monooxygenase YgiN
MDREQQADCFSPVVELRQYTLHPGARDVLIDVFDREFVESQEEVGIRVLGQFRDLDDPDRFVWLRGFRDMPQRAEALAAFYGGPAWLAHRDVANATMVTWNNVLLLRPSNADSGFSFTDRPHQAPGSEDAATDLVVATIYYLATDDGDAFASFFGRELQPVLTDAGATILAHFVTEHSPNTFPALPVRENESVFVWFSRFRDAAAYDAYLEDLRRSPRWSPELQANLARRLTAPPEMHRLSPTARSLVPG